MKPIPVAEVFGPTDLPTRIASKIAVAPSGCWEWTGARSGGYGMVWMDGTTTVAHRVVYRLLCGPIAPGLQVDHLCRNRSCVNPDHLEAVTSSVNTHRSPIAPAAVNALKECCPSGHEYTFRNDGRRRCYDCERPRARDYQRRMRKAMA